MNHRVLPLSGSRFQPDIESVAVTREKFLSTRMKAATSTASWKTEEKIPPNTRRRRMPGENFINTYEETRKALEEVDANRNETDLDEETQKALEEIDANQKEVVKSDLNSHMEKAHGLQKFNQLMERSLRPDMV